MLVSWQEIATHAHWTEEELHEATTWLAANNPPRYKGEHLASITARIRERRAVECRRHDAGDDRGTCATCSGSGLVSVPDPRSIVNGEWRPIRTAASRSSYTTAAVLCHCPIGRIVGSRRQEKYQTMTIARYEEINPNWRDQLRARQREQQARANLRPDPEWEATMERLLGHVRERQADTEPEQLPAPDLFRLPGPDDEAAWEAS